MPESANPKAFFPERSAATADESHAAAPKDLSRHEQRPIRVSLGDIHHNMGARSDRISLMETLRRSPLMRSTAYIALVVVCLAGLVLIRELEPRGAELRIHGAFDVAGHLITALIAAIGVRALRLPVPMWAILFGGVVLDLGHTLNWMGYTNALEGSSRNGSHSLFVVAVLACLGFLDRKRANMWLGIAIGATSHLWRDMGTGTVALMWPITDTVYGTLFNRYLAVLAGMALAMIGSSALLGVYTQSHPDEASRRQDDPASRASGWEM